MHIFDTLHNTNTNIRTKERKSQLNSPRNYIVVNIKFVTH